MCLVSYHRTKNGYILSSNRDEAPQRSAKEIKSFEVNHQKIFFPADSMGGSWIFVTDRGDSICLLNGAFVAHQRKEKYRLSRGVMLRSFFDYPTVSDFLQGFDFWDIEPFTVVIVSNGKLYEFRWDGQIKSVRNLDIHKTHLWSSCTLYSPEIERKRKELFMAQLAQSSNHSPERMRDIHLADNGLDIENAFVMDRNGIVKTISFTQIDISKTQWSLSHTDLETNALEIVDGGLQQNL